MKFIRHFPPFLESYFTFRLDARMMPTFRKRNFPVVFIVWKIQFEMMIKFDE